LFQKFRKYNNFDTVTPETTRRLVVKTGYSVYMKLTINVSSVSRLKEGYSTGREIIKVPVFDK